MWYLVDWKSKGIDEFSVLFSKSIKHEEKLSDFIKELPEGVEITKYQQDPRITSPFQFHVNFWEAVD
jgi:hypothetical protein